MQRHTLHSTVSNNLSRSPFGAVVSHPAETLHAHDCVEQSKPIAFGAVASLPAETLYLLDYFKLSKPITFSCTG